MKHAIFLQIDEITAKKGRIPRDFSLKETSEFNRLWKNEAGSNIAIKSLLERRDTTNHDSFQISNRRVPVNRHIR
ncbi:MAG: hypothetical protein M1569_00930, partial [Candidatus Marsarchaeota archaeon]|nr:hypothetical protein [Candidatus Marsarchaeota archaeon]